jgi:hypothetical protein
MRVAAQNQQVAVRSPLQFPEHHVACRFACEVRQAIVV